MQSLYFASTNPGKVLNATSICTNRGINITPIALEIDEIQGEDPERIVLDKVRRAYEKLGKPVVVSDDSWAITALHGFPGAYMKSMNHWFTSQDFLRLMDGITDRTITLHQYLAYTDGIMTKTFTTDLHGNVTYEAKGVDDRSPSSTVVTLEHDNGKTIAETQNLDDDARRARFIDRPDVWHEFVAWYTQK